MIKCCKDKGQSWIYQGEPIGGVLNVKDDEGHYLSSMEGYDLEMIIIDQFGTAVKRFSTDDGTIEIGVETVDDEQRGYASWAMTGAETAKLPQGRYTIELARRIDSGRGIGQLVGVIEVKDAKIRNGVSL